MVMLFNELGKKSHGSKKTSKWKLLIFRFRINDSYLYIKMCMVLYLRENVELNCIY